jgi:chromosome segregation ATPase
MNDSQNLNNDAAELIKSLQSVATVMTGLLGDLRNQSVSLATVKAQLEDIRGNVDMLSHIVRDGNNGQKSLLTRVSLVEQNIEEVEKNAKDIKEAYDKVKRENADAVGNVRCLVEKSLMDTKQNMVDDKAARRDKLVAKYQMLGAALAAAAALGFQVFSMIVHK